MPWWCSVGYWRKKVGCIKCIFDWGCFNLWWVCEHEGPLSVEEDLYIKDRKWMQGVWSLLGGRKGQGFCVLVQWVRLLCIKHWIIHPVAYISTRIRNSRGSSVVTSRRCCCYQPGFFVSLINRSWSETRQEIQAGLYQGPGCNSEEQEQVTGSLAHLLTEGGSWLLMWGEGRDMSRGQAGGLA